MSKFEESNFYKSLQDFFINNNKDTFLQFLGEFYNRTESIIDKNKIQDELIKELRELYLEINEKGIDENIVREKVNHFLENSLKINDIISKLNTNTNKIENISTQLDTNTKNKYDDVIISGNELSMKANGVVKKIIQLPSAGGTIDTTTIFNELNTTNKTIIGAINELFALIKNNGSGSENTTASGIKVEPTSVNIKVNGTADITMLFGNDVTNKRLEFMSNNVAIASVSDLGSYKYRITGVGQGNTTIRFRTSDGKFETSCSVTVTSPSTSGGGTGGGSTSANISNASETAITQQYSTSHEATPNNPNPPAGAYNWLTKPRINPDGSFPQSTWNAIGHWMTTYKVQGSNYYDNVGLLLQDPKAWIWNTSTRSWDVLSDDFEWGTWYREDFWDDGSGNITGTTQWETGVSANHSKWVKIKQTSESSGRCFHPWGYQKNWRSNSNWANNGQPYIVTKVDFKLIKYDENGVDNLDKARLVVNSGADWWRNVGDTWQPDWSTSRDMAVGKYILATKELKRAWCTNLPQNWQYGLPE